MTDLNWEWFGTTFSLIVVLVFILILFFSIYFYVRWRRKPPQVDKKAGDEGED